MEEIKYSDPMSNPALEAANRKMETAVAELRNVISGGNTEEILAQCEIARKAVQERNSICKANK